MRIFISLSTGGDNHMKKKTLLGILAVLMVFALALTGCGQQGEQNAGATGSESQNEAIDNGNSSADEIVETEPENGGESPNDNTSSNKSPTQDADGNYIYTITVDGVQTEVKTCINVWNYITDDTPYNRVDLPGMAESLGWRSTGSTGVTGFGLRFDREDGIIVGLAGTYDSDDYNLPTGERRVYDFAINSAIDGLPVMFDAGGEMLSCGDLVFSKSVISGDPFLVGDENIYVSFDQIVVFACFVDFYRDTQVPLFRTPDALLVNVP